MRMKIENAKASATKLSSDSARFGDGWIYGGNLKRRAKQMGQGIPDKEPWYLDDAGDSWSAYDVRFVPDTPTT